MFTIDELAFGDFSSFLMDEATSTMDVAREYSDSHGSTDRIAVILARRQTQGRGRGGSQWVQAVSAAEQSRREPRSRPFADILLGENDVLPMTLVIPPGRIRIPWEWVTLAAGCAIADALKGSFRFLEQVSLGGKGMGAVSAESIRVKWPNDIVLRHPDGGVRKLCGVLCETSFRGGEAGDVLMGIGLNFFEAPTLDIASSLWQAFLEGRSPSDVRRCRKLFSLRETRDAVLRDFCIRLQVEISDFLGTPRTVGQLRALALERSLPMGTPLSVNKGESVGTFAGIDTGGRLLLSGHSDPIVAGDVAVSSEPVPPPSKEAAFVPLLASNRVTPPLSKEAPASGGARGVLACDFGNTRMHWGFEAEGGVLSDNLDYGVFCWEREAELRKLLRPFLATLRGLGVLKCLYVSVADRAETARRMDFLKEFFLRNLPSLKFEPIEVSASAILRHAGLEGQYAQQTLGADRALRFLFAARQARECGANVVTCGAGTAITLEGVSAAGSIVESGIFPGFRMMLQSLHQGTARLPVVAWPLSSESEARAKALPDSENSQYWTTEKTLREGVELAVSGAVIRAAETSGASRLFLSGGDASVLFELLAGWAAANSVQLEVVPGLELQVLLSLASKTSELEAWRSPVRCTDTDAPAARPVAPSPTPEEPTPGVLDHAATAAVVRSMSRSRKRRVAPEGTPKTLDCFRRLGPRVETDCVGIRLDRHLAERYRFYTRDQWRERIYEGDIIIQSNAACVPAEAAHGFVPNKHTYRMKLHDQLWFYHPLDHEPDCMADVEVLGDDGDVVVFSKPGNLVIHAVGQYSRNTFLAIAERMGYANASPVHRIDRETSGILLCARGVSSRRAISDAFRNGDMEKMYLAVCKPSQPLPRFFRVTAPIGDAVGSRIRLKLWVDGPNALSAETRFLVLSECEGYSLIACYPQTGRTNQIRIHLAAVGAWIVGDKMYHDSEDVFLDFYEHGLTPEVLAAAEFPRHMLHNAAIRGPKGLAPLISHEAVVCHIPQDMMSFLPLLKLLEMADIPTERAGHDAALRALFERRDEPELVDAQVLQVLEKKHG